MKIVNKFMIYLKNKNKIIINLVPQNYNFYLILIKSMVYVISKNLWKNNSFIQIYLNICSN